MAPRALALPAIAVAVLPKCPMCVMVVLGALRLAHPLHETVFALFQGAALTAVVALLAIRRRGAPAQVLLGAAGACAVMLASAGPAPPAIGYAGAILLAAVWLARPGGTATPSCGCEH
jgi:hypothetical protein